MQFSKENRRYKISWIPLLLFLWLPAASCSSDDAGKCVKHEKVNVHSVTSPESGKVNEPVDIIVEFTVYNGCGDFGKFIQREEGNVRFIEVEAKYTGCTCTHNIPNRTTHYKFTAAHPGDYVLNFKSGADEYITVNLAVE